MNRFYDILILGGGMAALSAATAARQQAPAASIAMVSDEALPPYSRPMLTKLPLLRYDEEKTLLHDAQWYVQNRIELILQTKVLALHPAERSVETSSGAVSYGRCIYALGASNFIPPFAGATLHGVCSIRSPQDVRALRRRALRAKRAVVIGGGVIGLEAAYLLAEQGIETTVLETAPYLMPRLLDETSATYLLSRITRFSVRTGVKVLGISGTGAADGVMVEGMEPIPADLVVISCGVRANCAIAQAAGAKIGRAVVVDAQMQTTVPDLYACGDCAEYLGQNTALWAQAAAQGAVAGANAAGGTAAYDGADAALILNCPEFSLYSVGDLGKDPNRSYTEQLQQEQRTPTFEVNPRPHSAYAHDFYADGKLVGTFLLGDVSAMQDRANRIFGEQK